MDNQLLIQYIIVALLVLAACYSIFRLIAKNFAPRKFSSKRKDCDRNCGCS